jgi:mediator of RNA polymerase II transcription subunit 18
MDISTGLRNSSTPQQEFLLQGSILDEHRGLLLNRLKGLCDMCDSPPEKFHDHEMVFALRGPPSVQAVILGVRHALDYPDDPWHIRYIGQADVGDRSRHTLVRSCVDVGTTENIRQFLSEMGFTLDYEYVIKGFLFRRGRLKVTVSKLNKITSPGNPEMVEPLSTSHLVELSVVALQGQDQIQEDMKNFAEQLKPLVNLEKVDHRRLQSSS